MVRIYVKKVRNIYSSLSMYTLILGLIAMLFVFCFWTEKNKSKNFFIFYLVFFVGILSYISLEGNFKYRVLLTALLPCLFFFYATHSILSNKNLKLGYWVIMLMLSIIQLNDIRQIKNYRDGQEKIKVIKQYAVLEEIKDKNVDIIPFVNSLTFESFCSPFNIGKVFDSFSFSFFVGGWFTNIPFNKGHFDSYMSLVDTDTYIFISSENARQFITMIQEALILHYDTYTEKVKMGGNADYYLIQLRKVKNL